MAEKQRPTKVFKELFPVNPEVVKIAVSILNGAQDGHRPRLQFSYTDASSVKVVPSSCH